MPNQDKRDIKPWHRPTRASSACPDLQTTRLFFIINYYWRQEQLGTIEGNCIIEKVPVYGEEIILVLLGDLCVYGLHFLKQP